MIKVRNTFFMSTEELIAFNKNRLLHYTIGPHFILEDGTVFYRRIGSYSNLSEYDDGKNPEEISEQETQAILNETWKSSDCID